MAKTTTPSGPVPLHYSMATGKTLKEATAKATGGGTKKDVSKKSNK